MRHRHAPGRSGGFSLIELLVVVAIMMVLAAMITPAIGRYFRNYRIREAQDQIATSIQRARGRAISKNVNFGVSFVIESPTRYWIHVEDDQSAARSRNRQTLNFAAPDPGQSAREELPRAVRFAASAAECPLAQRLGVATYAPNGGWFRFNRLGAWSGCATAACSAAELPAASVPPNALMQSGLGTLICVYEEATGLHRPLLVSPGGRVQMMR